MNVGKAIFNILSNDATVGPLVKTGSNPYRIFPVIAAQNQAMPFITYQKVSNVGNPTKDGPSELDTYRYQVNVVYEYGLHDAGQTLVAAVRAALDRKTPGTYEGISVHNIMFDSERDDFTNDPKLSGAYMTSQDFIIWVYR